MLFFYLDLVLIYKPYYYYLYKHCTIIVARFCHVTVSKEILHCLQKNVVLWF